MNEDALLLWGLNPPVLDAARFDYLVTGGILNVNPTAPKLVIVKGKTPVLSADEASTTQ